MKNFFRKIISLSLLSLFVLPIFAGTASAQGELFFGQNHSYTVIFRGNGEAITYAKIAITNPDEKPLTEFSFEIPKVSPTEIAMYQMKLPQECVRYDYKSPGQPCLEWRDPDYAQRYYYYGYGYREGQTEYQKIQFTRSGSLYRFTLPTPVEPYKSTAIVVAYAAKGYVKQSFGLFKFNFETIKVPSRIEQIRVAVDVDSDLLLKGKRAQVDYGVSTSELAAPQAISSRDLDRVVGKIGSYGPLVKEAKNLAPNETFIVRGEYATNWFRLYLSSILITILIIAAIFAGVYFLAKFLKRRGGQSGQFGNEANQQMPPQTPQSSISILNLTNVSVSLLSVVLVVGLTYLLRFLLESDLLRSVNIDPVFGIVGFIAIILLYVLVIFGPAIIVAIKHGWKSLVSILIAEFLWFVIFLVLYFILFQSGLTSNIFRPGPVVY
jgi:hypothetical protein